MKPNEIPAVMDDAIRITEFYPTYQEAIRQAIAAKESK